MILGLPFVVMGAAGKAMAKSQYFFIQTSNTVTPDQPSTEVEVWAAFDPAYFAFGWTQFDIASAPDEGAFYDPRLPFPYFFGKGGDIAPDGDSITGVQTQQEQYPPSFLADISNPIMIWSCSWTTADFTPRRLDVDLLADRFGVYFNYFGDGGLVEFAPGTQGYIQVVPAPGARLALFLAGAFCGKRRR